MPWWKTAIAGSPTLLIARLKGLAPTVRAAAVNVLLSRDPWTRALLVAASKGEPTAAVNLGSIEPARQALLLKHRDSEIARLARGVFHEGPSRSRAGVVTDYLPALQLNGDADRGRQVFTRECKSCHKVGEIGFAIGPDLTGSPSRDSASLLNHILDPNAYVLPSYIQYVIADQTGRTYTGIIAAESGSSVTLRRADGVQDTLLRGQIDGMTSTGQSLMPEGLEKSISRPEMADLISFLRGSHRGDANNDTDQTAPPRLDIGTLPGLIEPDE